MLSFNLESASHTLCLSLQLSLFFFLCRLYLTYSGFSVTMRKGRGVSDRQRQIENAKRLTLEQNSWIAQFRAD